jgi:hypothetical protein
MTFVIGATSTGFQQQQSGGGTVPTYSGAATSSTPMPEPADDGGQRLVRWQQSAEARQYEGRWVLLDPDALSVLDTDSSPSDLLARRSGSSSALVVYVQPAGRVVV